MGYIKLISFGYAFVYGNAMPKRKQKMTTEEREAFVDWTLAIDIEVPTPKPKQKS